MFSLIIQSTVGYALSPSRIVWRARESLRQEFDEVDARVMNHIRRVVDAFHHAVCHIFANVIHGLINIFLLYKGIGAAELNGGLDGYAHGDLGREAIDGVFAQVSI